MPVYAALYRAWRPHRLADVIGQEHVTRTLRNALRQGHSAHAYLFCGPRGTGKTSTARILAAALNCERPQDGDACGECERCREVAADRLVDVQEIDAASHRQVEDIRALRETVGYAPAAGRHKVYILDEVHMLTDASWNTLLKTLEEPPPATSFVLCTTDPRKVLPTVVSRCQRFDFRRLSVEEIVARLQDVCAAEGIVASQGALTAIARRSDGGLRDALSILDQATAYVAQGEISATDIARIVGAADEEAVERLLAASESGDARTMLLEIEGLYADGRDMAQVARDLLGALRDRLGRLVDAAPSERGRLPWHLRAIEVLAEAEGNMRRWSQPRLVLEIALLQMCGGSGSQPPESGRPGHVPARTAAPPSPAPPSRAPVSPPGSTTRPAPGGQPGRAEPAASMPPQSAEPRPTGGRDQPAPGPAQHAVDVQATWVAILQAIRSEQPARLVGLTEAKPLGLSDGVLRLAVPDGVLRLAVTRSGLVQQMWQRVRGGPVQVEFVGSGATPSRNGASATTPVRPSAPTPRPAETLEPGGPPPPPEDPPSPEDMEAVGPTGRSATPLEPRPLGASASTATRPEATEALFRKALMLFEGTPLA